LDLLSAADENEIEPTRAAGGRQAMYPEVSITVPTIDVFLLVA
jgi:hypothetical protein